MLSSESGRRRCDSVAGARGVVGVNKGVSIAGGSEFSSMDRSVARRVRGLTRDAPGLESDGEVVADPGEVTIDIPALPADACGWWNGPAGRGDLVVAAGSAWMRAEEGRASEDVMGELRTASRTGSKAGMAFQLSALAATFIFLAGYPFLGSLAVYNGRSVND